MPSYICSICKKPLIEYTSVKLGIGPICRARQKLEPELPLFDHANFSIIEITDNHFYIKDNGGNSKSITTDAEWVIDRLTVEYGLKKHRVFYMDTMGQIDELVHNNAGRFVRFKAGYEGVKL